MYMAKTNAHRSVVCSARKVRAISGSPANFCPVWFQRLVMRRPARTTTQLKEVVNELLALWLLVGIAGVKGGGGWRRNVRLED